MKYIFFFSFISIIYSCSNKVEEKTVSIDELSKKWFKLTELNSDTVLYQPCDAANRYVWINRINDLWILVTEEGHESSFDTINSLTAIDNDKLRLEVSPEYSNEATEFYITIIKKQELAVWTWTIQGRERTELFATENGKSLFQYVEQPCKECWDDEICNEKEESHQKKFDVDSVYGIWTLDPEGPHADFFIDSNQYYIVDVTEEEQRQHILKPDTLILFDSIYPDTFLIEKAQNDSLVFRKPNKDFQIIYTRWKN